MTAKQVIQQHYEMTELIIPSNPPPPVKIKQPPPPEMPPPPEPPKVQLQERQIVMPKPKPEPKPIQMEAKVTLPAVKRQAADRDSGSAAQGGPDGGHAGAKQSGEAVDGARCIWGRLLA